MPPPSAQGPQGGACEPRPPRSVDLGGAPVSHRVGRCCLLTHLPLSPSGIGRVTQPGSIGWFPYKPWMPQLIPSQVFEDP